MRWNAEVVKYTGCRKMYVFDFHAEGIGGISWAYEGSDWKGFKNLVKRVAGIELPPHKNLVFTKRDIGCYVAGINASRPGSCIVTESDYKNGWNPWTF